MGAVAMRDNTMTLLHLRLLLHAAALPRMNPHQNTVTRAAHFKYYPLQPQDFLML